MGDADSMRAMFHNHPFDAGRIGRYYSFSAFFTDLGSQHGRGSAGTIIFNKLAGGGVKHRSVRRS